MLLLTLWAGCVAELEVRRSPPASTTPASTEAGEGGGVGVPHLRTEPRVIELGEPARCLVERPLSVASGGTAPVTVTAAAGSPGVSLPGVSFPITLAPGEARRLTVAYTPEGDGPIDATLTLTSDDPAGPVVVALRGVGVDPATDSDGDGVLDCDGDLACTVSSAPSGWRDPVADCVAPPSIGDPWRAELEWSWDDVPGIGVEQGAVVGRMLGEQLPVIAVITEDVSRVVLVTGDGTTVLYDDRTFARYHGLAMADVDLDGRPELLYGANPIAMRADGDVVWRAEVDRASAGSSYALGDLDDDEAVEVVFSRFIIEGDVGVWSRSLDREILNGGGEPRVADLDLDGSPEILLRDSVFDRHGALLWSVGDFFWNDHWTLVIDADGDPEGEVLFVSGAEVALYDPDGTELSRWEIDLENGSPCAADLDADGSVEVVIPQEGSLVAYRLDGAVHWEADSDGHAGCAVFDFDRDGAYEVVYADRSSLRILDGTTGVAVVEDARHSSEGCVRARPCNQVPAIADVDDDGSAEIVVVTNHGEYEGFSVFGSPDDVWPRGGSSWPTYGFSGVEVDDHGRVAPVTVRSWQLHNLARGRPPLAIGDAADLRVELVDSCVSSCVAGEVRFAWQAMNLGGASSAPAEVRVIARRAEDLVLASTSLRALGPGEALASREVALSLDVLHEAELVVQIDSSACRGVPHEVVVPIPCR